MYSSSRLTCISRTSSLLRSRVSAPVISMYDLLSINLIHNSLTTHLNKNKLDPGFPSNKFIKRTTARINISWKWWSTGKCVYYWKNFEEMRKQLFGPTFVSYKELRVLIHRLPCKLWFLNFSRPDAKLRRERNHCQQPFASNRLPAPSTNKLTLTR